MAKNKSETFQPLKGKLSAINKSEGLGASEVSSDQLEQFLELSNEYTLDDNTIDPSIPVRHPNRNVSKNDVPSKGKPSSQKADIPVGPPIDPQEVITPEEITGVLEKEQFTELADYRTANCATIYLPTHESGVAVNEKQDAISFKNALREAADYFRERGLEQQDIDRILAPGYELMKDETFWTAMKKGLAVFIADGYFRYMKLSQQPAYRVQAGGRFYMAPFISAIGCDDYFYLLLLSQQKCRLFKADAQGMQPVEVEGLPEEVMAVKRISEKDASTVRVGTGSGTGGANFHGMAGGNPDTKDNIAVYFEAVDDVLFDQIFHNENAPLLLAGVDYLLPIYRSACDYHNVCKEAITGNYEHEPLPGLYAKAREMMEQFFAKPLDKALTIFANQSATELTSSIVDDVIPAAFYGRISHLFARKNEQAWDEFDEANAELKLHNEQQENSEDLLDLALIKTLRNGGEVYLLDEQQMPAPSNLAAVFRY